jgi:hypothetical protein
VVTSDLFTVAVTVPPCSGATVFNGAFNGPKVGTYTTGLVGSFSAGWSNNVFTAQNKNLCWAATDIVFEWQKWPNAVAACAALTTDGASWRLPNLKELQFLYEAMGGSGSLPATTDLTALNTNDTGTANEASAMQSVGYWSSTEASSGIVYGFAFYKGSRDGIDKTDGLYVRCVRSL